MATLLSDEKRNFDLLQFDKAWSFAQEKYESYSHNYHRYPAKFISPLAHKLISSESRPGDWVCDIFGGCGTTLLEAKILGRKSLGYDINPVAKLITEVKTKAIKLDLLLTAKDQLLARIEAKPDLSNDYENTHKRIQYWFSEESYLILSHIYDAILVEDNQDIQKFFLCAFSHCLKNSSRWLMKSIKPTIDKQKKSIEIHRLFNRHLTGMIKKNSLLYEHLQKNKRLSLASHLYLKDITKLKKELSVESVDLIVTSPPYVTSYEYGDLHELTLLWFGQKNYKKWQKYLFDFRDFKCQFIGSNISKITDLNIEIGSDTARDIVAQLAKKDKPLANKVNVYFLRMYQAFETMYGLLKEGKKACVVIGNTKLREVPILNAEVALEQLLALGFKEEQIIKRDANTNKMITPYRDKITGKFASKDSKNKTIAYHKEYILKVKK